MWSYFRRQIDLQEMNGMNRQVDQMVLNQLDYSYYYYPETSWIGVQALQLVEGKIGL